ncbi:MAG: hypothetical protein NDJ89_06005 [Oligoflexia bacterium]|nr:hypothetical protein [Oligoflexia bacterium]
MSRFNIPIVTTVLGAIWAVNATAVTLPDTAAPGSSACENARHAGLLLIKTTDEAVRSEIESLRAKLNSPELDAVRSVLPKMREAVIEFKKAEIATDFTHYGLNIKQAAKAAEIFWKSPWNTSQYSHYETEVGRRVISELFHDDLTSEDMKRIKEKFDWGTWRDAKSIQSDRWEKVIAIDRELRSKYHLLKESEKWRQQYRRLQDKGFSLSLNVADYLPGPHPIYQDVVIGLESEDGPSSTHHYSISNPSEVVPPNSSPEERAMEAISAECRQALSQGLPQVTAVSNATAKAQMPRAVANGEFGVSKSESTATAGK